MAGSRCGVAVIDIPWFSPATHSIAIHASLQLVHHVPAVTRIYASVDQGQAPLLDIYRFVPADFGLGDVSDRIFRRSGRAAADHDMDDAEPA